MGRCVKLAISLSEADYAQLETERKATGHSRSRLVSEALKMRRAALEEARLVQTYEEGYRKYPEEPVCAAAWEKASAGVMPSEGW
jgi:hypothetical protein